MEEIRFFLMVAVLFLTTGHCLTARILAIFPFPGKSHFIFLSSIVKTLSQEGHQVVEYSPFPPSKPISNYSHVEIHSGLERIIDTMSYEDFAKIASGAKDKFRYIFVHHMLYEVCKDTFKDKNIQKLLKSNEKFDLVVTESTFGQESMVVFGHKFDAPVISLQTYGLVNILNSDSGNSLSLASIPDMVTMLATDQMSFTERMYNFISNAARLAFYYLYELPNQNKLIRQYYNQSAPPIQEMMGNISLFFVNSHPAIEYVRPYTPNIIPVAGINFSPDRNPLSQDLQKFMDDGKDGVIYFSLGSVVPTHLMPKEILQNFINVFSRLKQRVIWKISTESLPGLSKNVRLSKWLPQAEVLSHPNCVLFMTHGGLFSQYEALQAGVPTVGIPVFADQPYNILFSEHRGFGIRLDFDTLSEETLTKALNTVLRNQTYRDNAKRLSRIFRDRPVSATDSVVFWTEYVLRHGGAHHLKPASTRLSWYQLALLDVLAAILLIAVAFLTLFFVIFRKIIQILWLGKILVPTEKRK